jgi:iron complex transport system substrate-binding protein
MPSAHAAQRIACLQPSATVILDAVGELDRVVACTGYCADVVPQVADGSRLILADSWTADTAQIVAARPDLVIAAVPYQEKAVSEILKAGTRFLGFAPKTIADIYTDIATLAGAVGATDRGEQVIEAMKAKVEEVRRRTAAARRPRVWCEEWGKPLIASQTWVAELVDAAGGDFVGTPGRQATAEAVQHLDPEVIVAAWCGAGDRVPLEKIILDRGWQRTCAGLTGQVFCVRDEFLNTPAPTLLQGLQALAFAIHPELFPSTKGIRRIADLAASPEENSTR